jgi:trans-2,3-dihydro-3-hydroxyanthranilate isomerase
MTPLRYTLCDVFTDRPLAGNPLAVFTDGAQVRPERMQALARELNLSETVFVLRPQHGGHFRIRIFTPKMEIPFAGHPTLGAAFVIGRSVHFDTLDIETGRGIVPVTLEREGPNPRFGWMKQPRPESFEFTATQALLQGLGLERSLFAVGAYDNGPRHVFVSVPSAEALAALRPDLNALAALPVDTVSVFTTANGQIETRCFAPRGGIAEDPATGSAAGPLGIHLVRLGEAPADRVLTIAQGAHIERPSTLYARVTVTEGAHDVEVGGAAVVVARGEFNLL